MYRILIGLVVVVMVLGAVYTLSSPSVRAPGQEVEMAEQATYRNEELGFEFAYRAGSDGYVLKEVVPTAPDASGLVRTIVLVPTTDAEKTPPVGGEGPAVIAINVFTNAKKQWPQTWADEYVQYSHLNLKQNETQEAVVGGANAIRYMADGLYAAENVVVAHGEYMYVFTGMFLDADSQLRRDFAPLVDSVRFIPTPGQE